MKLIFLTNDFYTDYSACAEIACKDKRPYIQIVVQLNATLTFAIPLRSNIRHSYVFWTNRSDKCGIDFSKAVVITDLNRYIDQSNPPYIRPEEFKQLKGKDYEIKRKFLQYIKAYKKAKQHLEVLHNRLLCQYSTLQYFEEYI